VSVPENVPQKRYGLFILAIFLLLSAGAAFYVASDSLPIRSLAALALIASVYLVRVSHVHTRDSGARVDFTASERPRATVWFLGIALLGLAGVSYWLMHIDALHGGHTGWPAYMFAGVAVACAVVWGYIITKLVWRGR